MGKTQKMKYFRFELILLIGQLFIHGMDLVPRLSKGFENSGITEHTSFNCHHPKAETPQVLNISCPSASVDVNSINQKNQGAKIKIVQGVYGISTYPGIRCYYHHGDCFIDDIGSLKDCSGKRNCQITVDRRYLGHKCGGKSFSNYLMVAYQCIPAASIHNICESSYHISVYNGFIISPGYPSPYYKDINCQCNVSTSDGGLLFRVVDFSTTALNCQHDYVAVHTTRKIEKFCGEYPLGTFYRTRERQVSLQFITKLSARGFWLEYKARSSKSLLTLACASLSAPTDPSASTTRLPTWRSDASAPDAASSNASTSSAFPLENSSVKHPTGVVSDKSSFERDAVLVDDSVVSSKGRTPSQPVVPTKSRSCPYWEVGCGDEEVVVDGLLQDESGDDDFVGAGRRIGQISTILIVVGVSAFVVFFVVFAVAYRKRQSGLVRNADEDPPSSDNGGLGSFYRGAKLSLDSINSACEWNGVKTTGAYNVKSRPLDAVGPGGSTQSLEEWGHVDDFGLSPAGPGTEPRKTNFYRSRSFTMLDHVAQVSPYAPIPEIELSRSPEGLVRVGMMPTLSSLHYGDYGVLAVSPFPPPAAAPLPEPSPVTILTSSPVLTSNLDSSPQVSPDMK